MIFLNKAKISSQTPIDILIPAIDKDLGTLPYVIDALRKYVKHPISNIYVVSPDSSRIKALCHQKGCKFVHEHTLLPITKKDIHYSSAKWERSGWLYQQLLKLSGDTVCKERYFLVTDADTILIRPHYFLSGNKTIFYYRNWSQPEYYRTYQKLLGKKATSSTSFVAHYMLFDKTKLSKLKQTIEDKHHTKWYKAIIKSINKKKQFGFSEFETYGNFLRTYYPGQYILKKCLNKSFHMSAGQMTDSRIQKLAQKFRSLSFHKRKVYSKNRD